MLSPRLKMKLSKLVEQKTIWRRFSKSLSDTQVRDIIVFVYQYDINRILHIITLGFTKAGLKEEVQFKKDIYKEFKIRFPTVKQPNCAIEDALNQIKEVIEEEIAASVFVPALEID